MPFCTLPERGKGVMFTRATVSCRKRWLFTIDLTHHLHQI
ncbi:hypothetical protein STM14_1280 [Salmonella enterica subsp. enterica serovar Typhimurium str. 14028S]|uniref:Uncharacterized protein n=2 Tax=Salmonella enterica I TaxID=59201 RepID=A0A0F6AZU6_SALT1|nr:hypothetical protein SPAB_02421 [Salmonella enterica subsp. enterica serovar Paratyphi B str. SPB7]ACY87770.1 hypothetical protein STM14_1280 [Salmonella enterica subsp. enterica serovar Typhimurium str. 14028S]